MPDHKLELSHEDQELLSRVLSLGCRSRDAKAGATIWSKSVDCGDGFEVDVKVVNGLDAEDAPWVEAVLFEHGHEVETQDVRDDVVGRWAFSTNDIAVDVSAPEAPTPAP